MKNISYILCLLKVFVIVLGGFFRGFGSFCLVCLVGVVVVVFTIVHSQDIPILLGVSPLL